MLNHKPTSIAPAKLLPRERRAFRRYQWPPALTVEARWQGRTLHLQRLPGGDTISGGGLYLSLAETPAPPVDAELEISFPLVERPFHPGRVYARCRARVLRHDAPNRLAVRFQEVEFVREERLSGLPLLLPAEG